MSSTRRSPSPTNIKRSSPVPIAGGGGTRHGRARSDSSATGYSTSSDGSPVRTPPRPSLNMSIPNVAPPSAGTSPTSPLFSLLRAGAVTSPNGNTTGAAGKAPLAYPFASRGPLSALDDDETPAAEPPIAKHARRASLAGTLPARFPSAAVAVPPTNAMQTERGAGILRRLSLTGTFGRPPVPVKPPTPPARTSSPPSVFATSAPTTSIPEERPTVNRSPRTKRRSATLGGELAARPPRAPSPMGERILKGHFDSFH